MRRRSRGVVLVTCLFLALLLFSLTAVQVTRATFLSGAIRKSARDAQASLLARSAFNMALVQLRRSPAQSPNLAGQLGGGVYSVTSRRLSPSTVEVTARASLGGSSACVVGRMTQLQPSQVPFYAVRGPRYSNSGTLPTFWFPTQRGWSVLPPPSIPPTDSLVLGGTPGAPSSLGVGVDLENQPFFLTFPAQTLWQPPPPGQLLFVNTPSLSQVYAPMLGTPASSVQVRLHRFEQQQWVQRLVTIPIPVDGLSISVSRDQILATRLGRVMTYSVDDDGWRELVPSNPMLAGGLQVDELGHLYGMVRSQSAPMSTSPQMARWDGRAWQAFPGSAGGFVPLPDGSLVTNTLSKVTPAGTVPIALPTSLSGNVQKQMMAVDRDGSPVIQLVDRGAGGFGNDFRVWKLTLGAQSVPSWEVADPPNQLYDTAGQLQQGTASTTPIMGLTGGGNSANNARLRKVWEYR